MQKELGSIEGNRFLRGRIDERVKVLSRVGYRILPNWPLSWVPFRLGSLLRLYRGWNRMIGMSVVVVEDLRWMLVEKWEERYSLKSGAPGYRG